MRHLLFIVLVIILSSGCSKFRSEPVTAVMDQASTIVRESDVQWEALNPARGDKSPQAGTLWGDRNGSSPTGFLVKFVDGFSSPPHLHNVSYRGVVISGLIHNDDPAAADMWMPKGSYWTQPKGEVHITSAKGVTNVAYIEIEEGPYLVRPPKDAFDSGERPINMDPTNIVWLKPEGTAMDANGAKMAFLWGAFEDGHLNGTFLKLPAGHTAEIRTQGTSFRAVSIQGLYRYRSGETGYEALGPGSYLGSTQESEHLVSCERGESCVFYVRALGRYDITSR